MGAKNMVIAGDYEGKTIAPGYIRVKVSFKIENCIDVWLNKDTIADYTVVSEESSKSASSALIRGSIGEGLFGDAGMLAGALSAKNKGIYTIAINFKDGKRSLIEVDEEIYKRLIKDMF